jgi:Leucine-rich repeat (LRR) protein
MKEFKINEFLSLRLEDRKTNIYVNNELFRHCKYLLLDIPIEDIDQFDEIKSIDEIEMKSDRSLEFKDNLKINIPHETEFWAHCSNLQVWLENNYDTCLLHSDLAFPLLKRLEEVGDPLAKRRFKEEIAKRFEGGYFPTIDFLLEEGYDQYLSREELFLSLLGQDEEAEEETKIILELEKFISDKFHIENFLDGEFNGIKIMNHRVVELSIAYENIEILPESIGNLTYLKNLNLNYTKLKDIPKSFKNLKSLEFLGISKSELKEIPESIFELKSLKKLIMCNNKIMSIPESIKNLKSLERLNLGGNKIKVLPNSISELPSLKDILLEDNELISLPETIRNMNSLKSLNVGGNELLELGNDE